MSADNGVYILESPVHSDMPGTFEYRVVHCMAIENITFEPDREGYNTAFLVEYFERSAIFYDKELALLEAGRISDELPVLEYGIQTIKLPFPFPG